MEFKCNVTPDDYLYVEDQMDMYDELAVEISMESPENSVVLTRGAVRRLRDHLSHVLGE